MSDDFTVRRAGTEAVIVEHPATTQFYGVENPEEFFSQSVEEQRQEAIKRLYDGMDFMKSSPEVVAAIYEDAKKAGAIE